MKSQQPPCSVFVTAANNSARICYARGRPLGCFGSQSSQQRWNGDLDVEWITVFEIKKEIPDCDVPTFDPLRYGIQDAAIFEGLSPDDLKLVLSRASLRAARKGALLFHQGEPAREMFLLESGCVRLNEITADGRELLIRFVRPGEVFGDKAAIAGAEYGTSAVSDAPVRTYAWTTGMIVALLKEVPRLATNLFVITTRYLHYSRERYRLLATASAERRIRWALADLARSIGSPEGNATVITGRSIQRDVADLAATTIYTVNRVLSGYERRGILTRRRGRIVLFRKFQ